MADKLRLTIPIQFSATDHIPGLASNPGDAAGADAKRKLSIGIFTSIACCARTCDSQAAQKKMSISCIFHFPSMWRFPIRGSGMNTVARSAVTLHTPRIVTTNPAFKQEPGTFIFH